MRSKKIKLAAGALVIALVVSILPIGQFANAVKGETKITRQVKVKFITKADARETAFQSAIDEGAKREDLKVKDFIDDTENGMPQYYFRLETPTHVYFIEVHARTGHVLRFVEVLSDKVEEKKPTATEKEKDLKLDKKEAIAEFQKDMKSANNKKLENKDDFLENKDKYKQLKKDAIEEFKQAKDEIKAKKKEQKQELKENKNPKKKDEKPLNAIKYLTEKEIEEIALKKFNNNNIKPGDIEIELIKDNPPVYIVETYNRINKTEYELVIHATTGTILEYERALD